MAISTQEKRNIDKLWLDSYPYLNYYAQGKLYAILGPFLIGIEIIKLPRVDDYRPHFMLYPLYGNSLGSDIKSCLKYPVLQFKFRNQQGIPYDLPYKNDILTKNAILNSRNQISINMGDNIKLTSFYYLIDQQLQNNQIKAQLKQPDLFNIKFHSSLYISTEESKSILNEILNESKFWDKKKFNRYYGDFDEWYKNLEKINRDEIIELVNYNKGDKKLGKLVVFDLLK